MTESASPMHYGEQGSTVPATVGCGWCGAAFTPKRGWARFCGNDCRNAFHKSEARAKALTEAAPRMFEALQKIAAGADDPIALATAAIQDLKSPEPTPALAADRRDGVQA